MDRRQISIEIRPGAAAQILAVTRFPRGGSVHQVLNLREGLIVHIQDYRRLNEALAAAGLV